MKNYARDVTFVRSFVHIMSTKNQKPLIRRELMFHALKTRNSVLNVDYVLFYVRTKQ